MDKIKTVKIKNEDGSISQNSYTISVDAVDVDMANGKDLQDTIGTIDIDTDGNIATQLKRIKNYDIAIENIETNIENIETDIENIEIDISDLQADNASIKSDFNKKPYCFNTVLDMKAATELKDGDYATTLGFYTINDGGAGEYKISSNNDGFIQNLNNDLFAKLIIKEEYTPATFGCKEDGTTDDTTLLQAYFDYMYQNGYQIKLSANKTYLITNSILLDEYIYLEGNNAKIYCTANCPALRNRGTTKLQSSTIQNLRLQGANNSEYTNNIGIYFAGIYSNFENINISYFYDGIKQYSENISGNQVTCKFNNLNIRYNSHYGMDLGASQNGRITDGWITNCNIGSGVCGLSIGSCKGYFLDNLHF